MSELSAIETAEAVRQRRLSAVEAVEGALARIAERDGDVNAFVLVDESAALRDARAVDRALAAGEDPGPLAGVPFGVKDNLDCAGMPTRHGSLVYKNSPPVREDSEFVARLRAAGAIPVGKTALPEFAMDSSTHSPGFGVTRNPWDLSRTPGGSSGGSAAAVAAGMVPFATGSDIGGSIRSPAAFTGLVGLMPSHGRIPFAPPVDLDVLGALTTNAADSRRILEVAAGVSRADRHSIAGNDLGDSDVSHLRACWSPDLGFAVVEGAVAEIARAAAEALCTAAGITLVDRLFAPPNPYMTFIEIEAFEMAARLEAEGIYPDHADELAPLSRAIVEEWAPDRTTWMRARLRREEIVRQTTALFEDVDLLLTPTVACTAFAADGDIPVEIEGRDASASGAEPFTMLANMTWQPAISIPAGMSPAGLPIGLQVVAPRRREGWLLRLAALMEEVRPWPRTAISAAAR